MKPLAKMKPIFVCHVLYLLGLIWHQPSKPNHTHSFLINTHTHTKTHKERPIILIWNRLFSVFWNICPTFYEVNWTILTKIKQLPSLSFPTLLVSQIKHLSLFSLLSNFAINQNKDYLEFTGWKMLLWYTQLAISICIKIFMYRQLPYKIVSF